MDSRFPPERSNENRRWIRRRNGIVTILKYVGVSIERRCEKANRIMVRLFGDCPPMTAIEHGVHIELQAEDW
jgi:hypothetical protein